jgi:uncharacterized protein (DUF2225 family)
MIKDFKLELLKVNSSKVKNKRKKVIIKEKNIYPPINEIV